MVPEDDDWDGCEDSDPDANAAPSTEPKPIIQETASKSSLKKTDKKTLVKSEQELLKVNGFDVLRDNSDQEGDGKKHSSRPTKAYIEFA